MSKYRGITRRQERHTADLYRDTRFLGERAGEWLGSPFVMSGAVGALAAMAWAWPALAHGAPVAALGGALVWMALRRPYRPRMRYPAEVPGSSGRDRGIFVLGNDIEDGSGDELHHSSNDAREHYLVLGATGSGKTETLLTLASNPITMGGGVIYVDAKAEIGLAWRVFAMARAMGREHDLLVINYLTGNASVTEGPVKLSNTVNPFAFGSADNLTQALTSLLPSSGGNDPNQVFLERAVGLIGAIMYPLVELRDRGEIRLSPPVIREYLSLESCIRLAGREDLSPKSRRAIMSYLRSLPGYMEGASTDEQSEQVHNQFGFAQMYYTRMMSQLSEMYGHLFWTSIGEVDWEEAVTNDRIVLVLLPALEKSPQELRSLGKLNLSTLRAAISVGLGGRLEGRRAQVRGGAHANRATPTLVVLDEYGYIATEGFGVVPAQARGLGFSLVFAAQDWAGVKRGSQEEAGQVWGNTKTKIIGSTEDPETYKQISELYREGYVTQTAGYSVSAGGGVSYGDRLDASVDRRALVDPRDLMEQKSGEAHIFWHGQIVRAAMAYSNPPEPPEVRIMRFLRVTLPTPGSTEAAVDAGSDKPHQAPLEPQRDPGADTGSPTPHVSPSMQRVDAFARMLGIGPDGDRHPSAVPVGFVTPEDVEAMLSDERATAAAKEALSRTLADTAPAPVEKVRPAQAESLLLSAIERLST